MGAFIYLSLQRGTPPADTVFDALPNAFDELDPLVREEDVRPLTSFVTASEDQVADFLGEEAAAELGQEQWFEPKEGLKTVGALLARLENAHDDEDEPVIQDLERLRAALRAAAKRGDKFRLLVEPH
jgi:hypothetical protein